MGIDRSKMPPQLQDLLSKLEASGLTFEVGRLEDLLKNGPVSSAPSDDSKKDDCGCPACTLRRKMEKGYVPTKAEWADVQELAAKQDIVTAPPGIKAILALHADKLAERLVVSVQAIVVPLNNELQRQVEINDANMARIAQLKDDVQTLYQRYTDLDERFRKQTSLLHRRVTKRKGEVQDVKVRVATTRGRVTRVEKKLT